MSRISFNVHSQGKNFDPKKLLAHVEASRPPWMLIMDGRDVALDAQRLSPHTQMIHRAYPDEEIWKQKTPAQWIEQKKRELNGARLWLYTVNEQGLPDSLCNWFGEVIERSAPDDLQLVIGNMSAGTPQAADWTRPAVISLLRLCDKYRSRVVMGLHEYACGVITSGFLGGWPDNAGVAPTPENKGKGRNLIPFENWPTPFETALITLFHCGRFKFLVEACAAQKIKPPRIVLTEHGFDDMSDIKAWAQQQPQTPPYTGLRGWKSCENLWRKHYAALGWTPQRAMFEQLAYADRALYQASPVEGQLIFCWGHTSDMWDQFDVSGADEFLKLVAGQPAPIPVPVPSPPPAPEPPPKPVPVPPPMELQGLILLRDHITLLAETTRQMALKLGTITADLQKDVDLLNALIGAHLPDGG